MKHADPADEPSTSRACSLPADGQPNIFAKAKLVQTSPPGTLLLEATSLVPFPQLLPHLRACLDAAGVWTGGSPGPSPSPAVLELESHLHSIPSLYTALVRSGLSLRSSTHTALASLCSRAHRTPPGTRNLRLEIRSLTSQRDLDRQRDITAA